MESVPCEVLGSPRRVFHGSSWNEYLCLGKGNSKRFRLFTGRYQALAEREEFYNDETEDYDLPDEINGVKVVGIEDDEVIGGELGWFGDDETIEFDGLEDLRLNAWLTENRWSAAEILEKTRLAGLQASRS